MNTLFNKLWQYNDWANQSLISSFEQQATAIPSKSLHLLSHIMNAQTIWAHRIRGVQATVGVWDDHDLETCKNMHQQSSAQLRQEIESPEADLQQKIQYVNTKGLHFENQLDDILLHIFNHGTYHRAQIAQDLRINELEPNNTDYIAFVR
ncbi:DinB family protein [Pedobacter hartonius]|uniref:Uncharacterized damage-inducible protein DinB (Forms a four-helix bundle) n=1 Tax=Pedobacter hartonius TaxID=425514 RepID=A0A1H4G6I2_9SPHI|nr:DinB family protein [Pedobacter hartonius]SEB04650.1 Uncharacterized damage-inducible protein DinB (forms a four-helix bundle) [Pedobacter hartonius]